MTKTKDQHINEAKTLRYCNIHAEHTAEGQIMVRCKDLEEYKNLVKHYTGKGFSMMISHCGCTAGVK